MTKKSEYFTKFTRNWTRAGPGFFRCDPGYRAKNLENPEARILSKYPVSGLPGPENPVPGPTWVRTLLINICFGLGFVNVFFFRLYKNLLEICGCVNIYKGKILF